MCNGQLHQPGNGLLQFVRRLLRQCQHQVTGQVPEARFCGSVYRFHSLLCRVQPSQPFQLGIRQGLHPQRKPVDACVAKFPQLLRCHSGRICLQCNLRIRGQGKLFRRRFQNLCDLCRQQQRGRSAAEIDRVHAFRLGSVSVMPQVPADCRSVGGQQFRLCRHGIEVAVGTLPAAKRHVQIKSGTHQLNTSFRIGFTSGPKNASKSRHSTNAAATAPTM